MEIFSTAINQVLVMFVFIIIGYVLTRTGTFREDASKVLSTLLVYVATPALSFSSCANNIRIDNIANHGKMMIFGLIVLIVAYLIAIPLSKAFSKNDFEKNVYLYSFTISNIGYMGYPMVEAVFGQSALAQMMIFVFPMNMFIYLRGLPMLSSSKSTGLKFIFTQPAILSFFLGISVGLLGIEMPKIVIDVTTGASAMMAPTAMILTGSILAKRPFKELVCDKKSYFASIIRLIIIPLLALGLMLILRIDKQITLITIATLAMPLGLNTVVFPEAYGGDGRMGARLALVSHSMSLLTIPVIFAIISKLV